MSAPEVERGGNYQPEAVMAVEQPVSENKIMLG